MATRVPSCILSADQRPEYRDFYKNNHQESKPSVKHNSYFYDTARPVYVLILRRCGIGVFHKERTADAENTSCQVRTANERELFGN